MGLRQLHEAEPMFIDDGITDGVNYPSTSNAVYDALAGGGGGGGSSVLLVSAPTGVNARTDKTAQEIIDAFASGTTVLMVNRHTYEDSSTDYYYALNSITHYHSDETDSIEASFAGGLLLGDDLDEGLFYAD